MESSPFVTVDEALKYLGVLSRSTLYRRVADGSIPSVRLGGRLLVKRRELEALAESGPNPMRQNAEG